MVVQGVEQTRTDKAWVNKMKMHENCCDLLRHLKNLRQQAAFLRRTSSFLVRRWLLTEAAVVSVVSSRRRWSCTGQLRFLRRVLVQLHVFHGSPVHEIQTRRAVHLIICIWSINLHSLSQNAVVSLPIVAQSSHLHLEHLPLESFHGCIQQLRAASDQGHPALQPNPRNAKPTLPTSQLKFSSLGHSLHVLRPPPNRFQVLYGKAGHHHRGQILRYIQQQMVLWLPR